MSIPNRTPGHWHTSVAESDTGGHIEIVNGGGEYVCEIHAQMALFREREWASARLLAAAPELLSALEGLLKTLDDVDGWDCMEERDLAAAAITKAYQG